MISRGGNEATERHQTAYPIGWGQSFGIVPCCVGVPAQSCVPKEGLCGMLNLSTSGFLSGK